MYKCVTFVLPAASVLLLHAGAWADPAPEQEATVKDFFHYQRAGIDEAAINLYVEDAAEPVPEYLFGKFTEHLGRNIYNGMWAQVLRNPEMEPPSILKPPGRSPEQRENAVPSDVALYWTRYGEGEVTFSFDTDCISPPHSQKIEVSPEGMEKAGLSQRIFLPLHRVHDFDLELWMKGTSFERGVTITIQDASTGKELGAVRLPSPTPEWQAWRREIEVGDAPRGAPLDFIISFEDTGAIWLDHVTLFPKDNLDGFDPDVVRLLKESRLPLLRWPGGNFSSGYHWEDGIGPVERRRTLQNPAWPDTLEYNHVGTDEFIDFCRQVRCEPMICVNAGNGTPAEAARWVEYCNGDAQTEQGAIRAANGHPDPYGIVYWEIGNELYGDWQIGHCSADEYADRYRRFYDAIKAVDPRIKFVACGRDTAWNAPLIENDADILRSVSLHTLVGRNLNRNYSAKETFEALMAYTWRYNSLLRGLGAQMASKVDDPKIAITELQIFVFALNYPTNQTIAEALFYSGILHSSIRQGRLIEMITHSALVNHGGGLRKQREIVYANPVHWAHYLYANQPGRRPVRMDVRCAQFEVPQRNMSSVEGAPYLDPMGLLDETGQTLCVIVGNRHPERDLPASIVLHGFEPQGDVRVWQITSDTFTAANALDAPDRVRIAESTIPASGAQLTYRFPPHSLTALQFRR